VSREDDFSSHEDLREKANPGSKLQAEDNIAVLKQNQKHECHNQKEKKRNLKPPTGEQIADLVQPEQSSTQWRLCQNYLPHCRPKRAGGRHYAMQTE